LPPSWFAAWRARQIAQDDLFLLFQFDRALRILGQVLGIRYRRAFAQMLDQSLYLLPAPRQQIVKMSDLFNSALRIQPLPKR